VGRLKQAKIKAWVIEELGDLLARLSGSALDESMAALDAAAAADQPESVRDALVRLRIDRHFEDAASEYALPHSKTKLRVRGMFRITGGFNDGASWWKGSGKITAEDFKNEINRILKSSGKKLPGFAVHLNVYGRASTEDIRAVTQSLIDAGELDRVRAHFDKDLPGFLARIDPANFGRNWGHITAITDEIAVRLLQWEYAVGVDCAGYVQRAFLESASRPGGSALRLKKVGGRTEKRLKDGSRFGLKELGNENLYSLNKKYFKTVTPPQSRPGDLIILKKPGEEGHTVLLRRRWELSAAEQAGFTNLADLAASGERVHAFEVDASFGSSTVSHPFPNPLLNGVQRRVWLFNEANGKWSDADPAPSGGFEVRFVSSDGPYRHTLQAIYHPIPELLPR
jgi:hypothetical protein